MKLNRTILIFDDDKNLTYPLELELQKSKNFEFDIDIVNDIESYLESSSRKRFDLYVVDLHIDGLGTDKRTFHLGHLVVGIRHYEEPDSKIIVYSAHDDLDQVVWAMKNGASDFVSKKTGIKGLVAKIEKTLMADRELNKEKEKAMDILESGLYGDWAKLYSGQSIVVMKSKVICFGSSRLEAMLKYRKLCMEHPEYPIEPVIIDVPRSN